jgi:hypothetical protein
MTISLVVGQYRVLEGVFVDGVVSLDGVRTTIGVLGCRFGRCGLVFGLVLHDSIKNSDVNRERKGLIGNATRVYFSMLKRESKKEKVSGSG